jgi:hypothetical protein
LPSLADLQSAFGRAVLTKDFSALAPCVRDEGISAASRIGVYRNNVVTSLTALLAERFPVVERLVGDGFFPFAAENFIRTAPPDQPCLDAYGAEFPGFLAGFPSCAGLPYLADVARLEWKFFTIARADFAAPLTIAALAGLDAETAANLQLHCGPAIDYFAADWPADQIWQAHQSEFSAATIEPGACQVELRRLDGKLTMRTLPPAEFAFRRALADGMTLGDAVTLALGESGDFDFFPALTNLFSEQWVTGQNSVTTSQEGI